MPKGVMLAHSNLVVNVIQQRHWIADARRGHEVVLCVLPLSHSYGMTSCMNLSMAMAGSLVLMPTRRTDQILEAIKEYHPSLFPGIPSFYLALTNYPRVRSYGIASIRVCISGSAPLPVEVQEAFEKLTKGHLVEGYGLTEASPSTHSNPLKGERRVGSIGIPLPATNARIVDLKTGEPLAPGEVGELIIRGPQVMQGYWQMPEETAQVLVDGWLHTGDLARMDEDGFFTIVDRKKDLILAGAYNVYPRDVEEVLYEHPKVLEAAVVSTYVQGQTNGANGEKNQAVSPFIKAVVVLKRGEKATADELLALCRERLDAYKVPSQIEFRTALPKNIVGKVLRRLLIEA
jgi:long-chain acyl-CoA synthetase